MPTKPPLCCCDLEGVFTPEVWIAVHHATGIPELKLTTRDVKDYDELMRMRLGVLDRHGVTLGKIQEVIEGMDLLPGARAFLDRLRGAMQVVILSDTYYEFGMPFMRKLGLPTLLCHTLETDAAGRITGYHLRSRDSKREAVAAFQGLGFRVVAMGDSYNDTTMLRAADRGFLFHAPENVKKDFPDLEATDDYEVLLGNLLAAAGLAKP